MDEAQFEMLLADALDCAKLGVRDLNYRMLHCAKLELSRAVEMIERLLALQEDE